MLAGAHPFPNRQPLLPFAPQAQWLPWSMERMISNVSKWNPPFFSSPFGPILTMQYIAYPFSCNSSSRENLKQYKSQSFKTGYSDKSQQYATQHLSNKKGQSIKKLKAPCSTGDAIKLWRELIILLGNQGYPATEIRLLAPHPRWLPQGYSILDPCPSHSTTGPAVFPCFLAPLQSRSSQDRQTNKPRGPK